MVSFNFEDVIFLLNKWDILFYEDEDLLENYFEEIKEKLCKVWNDVDELCIFKIFVSKVLKIYIIFLKRNICSVNIFRF